MRPEWPPVLVDTEPRAASTCDRELFYLQGAQTCLNLLKELGPPTNPISPEFEDFGNKKYDPWYECNSQS